jgi:hypothetical protein
MKKHWLPIALAVFCAVLAASAVACSDGNNAGGGPTGTPAENTPVDGARPGASDEPVNVTFKEVNASGASGTATLVQTGQGLEVKVSLSGLKPGTYQAHIHPHLAGATCPVPYPTPPPGEPQPTLTGRDLFAVALPNLVVAGSGKAEATATISRTGVVGIGGAPVTSTLADFQDSNSKIEVYDLSHGIDGSLRACGDIPAS